MLSSLRHRIGPTRYACWRTDTVSAPGLTFDIIGVFLHGGVAEIGSRKRPQAKKGFPDIDSESSNEDQGEVK